MLLQYVIYLAVVMWVGCFPGWLIFLTRDQVDPWTWTYCKLGAFLFRFGRHYSSTLLVLMSVEKCFAVYFPLKSKEICTVRTAKWATGVVGVILAGCDLVYVFAIKMLNSKSSSHRVCVNTRTYRVIVATIDSVLYSLAPFVLMFVTNFAIGLKFMTAKCKSSFTESTNKALVKAATRGTTMVVTVSVTFLLLTAPVGLDNALSHAIRIGKIPLYRAFMNSTQYLNHSINGVLYCIVGSRFRRELVNLFNRKQSGKTIFDSIRNTSVTKPNEDAI